MGRKVPLITDQIAALQEENERLVSLQKLFDKAVKNEFGLDTKAIHHLIDNRIEIRNKKVSEISDFEQKICSYFNLYLSSDKAEFLRIICSQKIRDYYKNQHNNDDFSDNIEDDFSEDNDSYLDEDNYDYTNENE